MDKNTEKKIAELEKRKEQLEAEMKKVVNELKVLGKFTGAPASETPQGGSGSTPSDPTGVQYGMNRMNYLRELANLD